MQFRQNPTDARRFHTDVARLGRQITIERRDSLLRMLKVRARDVVFVNAFLNRKEFQRLVHAFAWETVAWFAEDPGHMIHFNGDKFLGSYRPRAGD